MLKALAQTIVTNFYNRKSLQATSIIEKSIKSRLKKYEPERVKSELDDNDLIRLMAITTAFDNERPEPKYIRLLEKYLKWLENKPKPAFSKLDYASPKPQLTQIIVRRKVEYNDDMLPTWIMIKFKELKTGIKVQVYDVGLNLVKKKKNFQKIIDKIKMIESAANEQKRPLYKDEIEKIIDGTYNNLI